METTTKQSEYLDDEESRINFIANLSLLQELHGIFGFAVSKAGSDSLKPLICAELALLGLKLARVSPALYHLENLESGVLEACKDNLSVALTALNRMVTKELIVDSENDAAAKHYAIRHKSSWAGLTTLHDIIAARYKTSPELDKSNPPKHASSSLSDKKLLSYLDFTMDIAEESQLLRSLSILNDDIEEILAAMPPQVSESLREPNLSDQEDDLMLIRQAQDYQQQISELYKTLAKEMCSCHRGHVAQFGLSNLGIDKDNLDLYISICCEVQDLANSQSIAWHLTKWSKRDQPVASSITGKLCQLLNEARERRLPAMLAYSGKTIAEDNTDNTETRRLPPEDLLWSFVDLAAVLEENPERIAADCKINATDKLRLQCLLTQSLLFLHPSSWMPETLKLDNIHFTAQKTEFNLKKPYMSCSFHEVPDEHGAVDIDAVADFMVHFALLLLQIEVGRPLLLLPDEEQSRYGHELALDRYMGYFSENLNVHFKQVLMDCLWFKKCLGKASHPKMSLDLKIRFVVSQHIFKPLVRCLEFNYPNVAREILTYSMEQRQEVKTIDIESSLSTRKRRIDSTDQPFPRRGLNRIATGLSEGPSRMNHSSERAILEGDNVGSLVKSFSSDLSSNGPMTGPQAGRCSGNTRPRRLESVSLSELMAPPLTFPSNRPTRMPCEVFTIGWISAIPLEKAVACAILDEVYHKDRSPWVDSKADKNSYTFGRLHGHNIVIACLPKGRYGNTSSAVVARDLRSSFPIKFGLLVGIAGGAPSHKHDIRLGDVVVGTPTPGYPGVLQYDYGKALSQHEFEQTGHMTPPPENILTTLANLEAHHKYQGHYISQTVSQMLDRNIRLKKECSRPSSDRDRLFKTSFKHGHQCPCQTSDKRTLRAADRSTVQLLEEQTIQTMRLERTANEDEVTIHYGLIASANQLMKDASARDRLVEKYDVLCFEMEAAGIVNSLPCVVIRGICDYSDSHKNDVWQGYAAANAAAYAKELLEILQVDFIGELGSGT